MNASSREEVFHLLRKKGIKAIKVVAADGSKANGEVRGIRKRVVVAVAISFSVISAILVYLFLSTFNKGSIPKEIEDSSIEVSLSNAIALPRQEIQGDRQRIIKASQCFTNKVDIFFAKFAEPGRSVVVNEADIPSADEIKLALQNPIQTSNNELTETIDLKRIVVGIRRELRIYTQSGGSIKAFIHELINRQEAESTIRKRAEVRLAELLNKPPSATKLSEAYTFWLTANAKLGSMGIYQIPLPEILREYQIKLNLED